MSFTSDQPEARQRLAVTLAEGTISGSHVDLGQHIVDIGLLELGKPRLVLYSSTEKKPKQSSPDTSEGEDFPGVWDMSGDVLKIEEGSVLMLSYNGSRPVRTGPDLTRFDQFETILKNVKLSSKKSAFNMSRLSIRLANGFKLEQGKLVFSSDSIHKTRLQADLKTTFSHIDLKILTGETLTSMMSKSFQAVPFTLFMNKTSVSLRELYSFMPPSDRNLPDPTRDDRLGMQGTFSGSMQLMKINGFELSTPAGLRLMINGSVSQLSDLRSANCNVDFRTNAVTSVQVKEMAELAGVTAGLPSFSPMVIKGRISQRVMAPEIALDIRGGSGNAAIDGSADLYKKSYDMELRVGDLKIGELAGMKDAGIISGMISLKGEGFDPDSMAASATVEIDKAEYKGYTYNDLKIEAKAETGLYTFQILMADSAAICNLAGHISHHDSVTDGEISGSFAVQTGKLHLYRDSIDFNGKLQARFHQNPSEMGASLNLQDLAVNKKGRTGILKKAFVSFLSNKNLISAHVESDFLKADFLSHVSLADFKEAFKIPEYVLAFDSSFYYEIPVLSALPDAELSLEAGYSPLINLFVADSLLTYKLISVNLTKETGGMVKGEIYLDKYRFKNVSGFATLIQLENITGKTDFTIKTDSIQFAEIRLGTSNVGLVYTHNKADITIRLVGRDNAVLYDISCEAIKREETD